MDFINFESKMLLSLRNGSKKKKLDRIFHPLPLQKLEKVKKNEKIE